MNSPFPFGFPGPTAFYLTLYLVTFLIHALFMNYVLAGSSVLAVGAVLRRDTGPISALLRDWLPFMLSMAITAGVAPLLFIQILFREQFYTANLLLFHRWMSILPVLMIGFYLCYLLKSKMVRDWPLIARVAVGCGPFLCFGFVGWSWVENHLLSVQSAETWQRQYEAGTLVFRSAELIPRLALWFVAAFPTLALLLGWQLHVTQKEDDGWERADAARRVAIMGLAGLVLMAIAAGIYVGLMEATSRDAVLGPIAAPYFVVWMIGATAQGAVWALTLKSGRLGTRSLAIATAGLTAAFFGMAVVREATRLGRLDLESLYAKHEQATRVGGFWLFLFFLVVNGAIIAYSVRLSLTARRPDADEPEGETMPDEAKPEAGASS